MTCLHCETPIVDGEHCADCAWLNICDQCGDRYEDQTYAPRCGAMCAIDAQLDSEEDE